MITGDNALTACHVAQEVSIMRRSVAILDGPGDESHPTTYTGARRPRRRPGVDASTNEPGLCSHGVRAGDPDLRWWNVHGDELRPVETSRREFEQALFDNDVCFTGRALMAVAAGTVSAGRAPREATMRRHSLTASAIRCIHSRGPEYPKNLGKLLAHVRVFARTSPQEKVRPPSPAGGPRRSRR